MAQSSVALRIGTRGSPLALAQAHQVRDRLAQAHGLDPASIGIQVIRTTGDAVQDRPLTEIGGKGLFTKEIEQALHDGAIDLAVHSVKDLPTVLPDGLVLAATLPREDVRDAFIGRSVKRLVDLPPGAVVGTASLRRQATVKRRRPDLEVVSFRGNVQTRLRKLQDGVVDATLLAMAGLKRLGLTDVASSVLETEEFLPAVGQGAIGIETRESDATTHALVERVNDQATMSAVEAERAFLAVLDGSCRTPIAALGRANADAFEFRGLIVRPDGSEAHETTRRGSVKDAVALGHDAGSELKGQAGPGFFDPQ